MSNAYLAGFGNEFLSEALGGALPQGQNNPQRPPYGLVSEQLSGTSFVVPRRENRRTWLYRIRPSVLHSPFKPYGYPHFLSAPFNLKEGTPNQMRWKPLSFPSKPTDFLSGMVTMGGSGDKRGFQRIWFGV